MIVLVKEIWDTFNGSGVAQQRTATSPNGTQIRYNFGNLISLWNEYIRIIAFKFVFFSSLVNKFINLG